MKTEMKLKLKLAMKKHLNYYVNISIASQSHDRLTPDQCWLILELMFHRTHLIQSMSASLCLNKYLKINNVFLLFLWKIMDFFQ